VGKGQEQEQVAALCASFDLGSLLVGGGASFGDGLLLSGSLGRFLLNA
jgi:hypothetical protein